MPSQAATYPDTKQMYINGHFCYADKFAILTNGLGIVRHISFVDDASSLVPVLQDFFSLHPNFHPDTFLGDSAFDSVDLYGKLFHDFHFSKALIPYNPRNESSLKKVGYNAYGYPTCPNDASLAMKYCGSTKEKGRAALLKMAEPLILMKTWIYVCSPVSSVTQKNGMTLIKYELS